MLYAIKHRNLRESIKIYGCIGKQCAPASGLDLSGCGGLFFCRGEVEEHFV